MLCTPLARPREENYPLEGINSYPVPKKIKLKKRQGMDKFLIFT
jgi:hypothetical protein